MTATLELANSSLVGPMPRWARVIDRSGLWDGLVEGAWSVAAEFDGEGCIYLVVLGNGSQVRAARAFNPREREVLARLALGQSSKWVSHELGICESCISSCLKDARSKVGVRSRAELIQLLHWGTVASYELRTQSFSVAPGEKVVLRIECRDSVIPETLTASERLIFLALCRGLSNAEIAARRGRSLRTVANQIASMFRKLSLGSRTELVARYRAFGEVFVQAVDPTSNPESECWIADRFPIVDVRRGLCHGSGREERA